MVMCLNQCDYPGENGQPCRCIQDQMNLEAAKRRSQAEATTLQQSKTGRGFTLIKFKDRYKQPCTLQKSSIATEDCIWLGVHTEIDLNTGEELGPNNRMHLTQQQVKELLPILQKFVETGEIH